MADPRTRAVDIIQTGLDLHIPKQIAGEIADALERDRLLADEDAVNTDLQRAHAHTAEAKRKLGKIRSRIHEHLDDPDVLTAAATADMPWHDRLLRDLINILDEEGDPQ